jgi:hypothetical protein
MTNFFIGTSDFLYLIAREITDSLTWCRFSQTCKRANKICNELLIQKIIKERRGTEVYTILPNGKKHGIAKRYKFDNVENNEPSNVFYYKDDNRRIMSVDWWSSLGN